jgi:hypothetical protein
LLQEPVTESPDHALFLLRPLQEHKVWQRQNLSYLLLLGLVRNQLFVLEIFLQDALQFEKFIRNWPSPVT